jgi:uncharacterized protein (UPF0548 family)
LFFSAPSEEAIRHFLSRQQANRLSYLEVGASRDTAPAGYTVDHNRIQLGSGRFAFEAAKQAIRGWRMFEMPWVRLCRSTAPIEAGTNVAVLVSHFGVFSLNPARIVYVIDEPRRFGFAYGTLRGHAEIGEERFSVEHLADDSVWYDLYVVSRPGPLARLGYPYARALQKKFARESLEAMKTYVASITDAAPNTPASDPN